MKSAGNMKSITILFLTGLTLLFGSCSKNGSDSEESATTQNQMTMEENEVIRLENLDYLALGDSYTIGEGVDEEMRWPNQLAARLETVNVGIKKVEIIARTGWTTRNLLDGIEARNPEKNDLVSLLIGVNNQYQKLPFSKFEDEFGILWQKAIELAGTKERVFVVSIPDYGVTPFGSGDPEGIGKEIDRYNGHIKEVCEAEGIPFVDITGISRELGAADGALAADRLHPSGGQYTAWTEAILPVVIDLLRND